MPKKTFRRRSSRNQRGGFTGSDYRNNFRIMSHLQKETDNYLLAILCILMENKENSYGETRTKIFELIQQINNKVRRREKGPGKSPQQVVTCDNKAKVHEDTTVNGIVNNIRLHQNVEFGTEGSQVGAITAMAKRAIL